VNRHLVVAVSDTPNHELPHARLEADLIARLLPTDTQVLRDKDATYERVTTMLPVMGLAHFACHALTASDPSLSYLSMRDAPLRVSDFAGLRNDDAYLAYLSACTTASGHRLLDEAIHVGSAFQLAGYRHVIGTLWPTVDRIARDIAALTYRGLLRRRQPAHAVHDAVLAMRAKHVDVPYLWGAHIHIGP
jgi:CHAT domain-containing protein